MSVSFNSEQADNRPAAQSLKANSKSKAAFKADFTELTKALLQKDELPSQKDFSAKICAIEVAIQNLYKNIIAHPNEAENFNELLKFLEKQSKELIKKDKYEEAFACAYYALKDLAPSLVDEKEKLEELLGEIFSKILAKNLDQATAISNKYNSIAVCTEIFAAYFSTKPVDDALAFAESQPQDARGTFLSALLSFKMKRKSDFGPDEKKIIREMD
jgi:hypothetical protein